MHQWPLKLAKGHTEGLSFWVIHAFWGSSNFGTDPFRQEKLLDVLQRILVVELYQTDSRYQFTYITQWPIPKKNVYPIILQKYLFSFAGHIWSKNWDRTRRSESGSGMSRGSSAKSYTPPKHPAWAVEMSRPPLAPLALHPRSPSIVLRNKVDLSRWRSWFRIPLTRIISPINHT